MAKTKTNVPSKDLITTRATSIIVKDEATFEEASQVRATLKDFVREVKASFRPIIKAAKDAHTEALAQERRKLIPFETALAHVEDAMKGYVDEKRRIEAERVAKEREKAEKKASRLEAQGKTERAEEILNDAAALVPITPATTSTSTGTKDLIDYEIIDEASLPDDYVTRTPNRALIRATVNARGMDTTIPGVRVFVKTGLFSR